MDILPVEKKWDSSSTSYFGQLVEKSQLEMHIHDMNEDFVYVSLLKKIHVGSEEPLCLNHLLVSMGKARGVGI